MKLLFSIFLLLLLIGSGGAPSAALAQQSVLPQITYLGQGPGTFTIDKSLTFIVKAYQNNQFLFITADPPTFQAKANERVWSTDFVPAEELRLFGEWHSYGQVQAGCVVNYVQIDDNVDDRRNTFYINGAPLQVVEQGMVTYGSFTIPEDGELTFYAEDSIGMVIDICTAQATLVPSLAPSATETLTLAPSLTATSTQVTVTPTLTLTQTTAQPSFTPTFTLTQTPAEPSLTPSFTLTQTPAQPSLTPTNTATLTPTNTAPAVVENSPTPTSTTPAQQFTSTFTPTRPPGQPGLATATQTPAQPSLTPTATGTLVPTPALIPVTGEGPGPREIAATAAALLGALGLTGAAWWLALRWKRNGPEQIGAAGCCIRTKREDRAALGKAAEPAVLRPAGPGYAAAPGALRAVFRLPGGARAAGEKPHDQPGEQPTGAANSSTKRSGRGAGVTRGGRGGPQPHPTRQGPPRRQPGPPDRSE